MTVIHFALIVCAVAFLAGLVRTGLGPSLADRAVAADVCLFTLVASLALLSVHLGSVAFVDVILVATLLGFVATVSLALLLWRRR